MRRITNSLGVFLTLVALALLAAPARAATFGPDLTNATADLSAPTCYWLGGPAGGCTVYEPSATFAIAMLPDPIAHGDQTGLVTQIHVVSAATMPAQFVVIEWSGKATEANPFPSGVSAISEQVTLHPGMNNFNTNLPIDYKLLPNGYLRWSSVSMSILDANVPVPMAGSASYATLGAMSDNWGPITSTSADLTLVGHTVRFGGWPSHLLMSGEVTITTTAAPTPTPTPTPTATPTPTPTVVPRLTLPARTTVRNNATTFRLRCGTATACAGKLQIRNRSAGARMAATKPVTYGSATFSIAAGKTKQLTIKLSTNGKRALKRRKTLKAYAIVTFSGGRVAYTPITLTR